MFEGKTVVIADDDILLAKVVAMRCRQLGMTTHLASNGRGALDLVREIEPDLLIVDLNMPGLGGLEICRQLGGEERFAQMGQIVLSGCSGCEIEDACRAHRARYALKEGEAWSKIRAHMAEIFQPRPDHVTQ